MTVQGLPRGLVRFGVTTIRTGDRLQPEQLPALVYVPEPGFSGPAGTFQYLVEDGRGGRAEGALDIEVMDPAEAAAQMAEAALWERLRASGRVEDVETFLRLYPNSYLAAAAQRRREELLGRNTASAAPPAATQQAAAPQPPSPAQSASAPATPAPASPPVAEKPKSPDKVGRPAADRASVRTNAGPAAAGPCHGRAAGRCAAGCRRRIAISRIARPASGWSVSPRAAS